MTLQVQPSVPCLAHGELQSQPTLWPPGCRSAPRSWTEDVTGAVTPMMITVLLDQHSCTGLFEFWSETFWMIDGSGKTLPSEESQLGFVSDAQRYPCIRVQRRRYGWWYFSICAGVTKAIAHWPIPNRLELPFRLQSSWLFAGPEDTLWCSAFKTPFQRVLTASGQVNHWCPQPFTATLPLLKLWLLHCTTKYTLACIHGTVVIMQSPKGLTKAIHHLLSLALCAFPAPHRAAHLSLASLTLLGVWGFKSGDFLSRMHTVWLTELRVCTNGEGTDAAAFFFSFFYEAMDKYNRTLIGLVEKRILL